MNFQRRGLAVFMRISVGLSSYNSCLICGSQVNVDFCSFRSRNKTYIRYVSLGINLVMLDLLLIRLL